MTEHQRREVEAALVEFADDASADAAGMIEQFCRDLNDAHNEILRLQGVQPEDYSKYDWPEWSAPANSIRWAERVLGKSLSKTSLRAGAAALRAQPVDPDALRRLVEQSSVRELNSWLISPSEFMARLDAVLSPRQETERTE
jgi:hypothetical protein